MLDKNPCDSCKENSPVLYDYMGFYFCPTCRGKILQDEQESSARKRIYRPMHPSWNGYNEVGSVDEIRDAIAQKRNKG